MEIFVGIAAALAVLFIVFIVVNSKNKAAAKYGLTFTVEKSAEMVRQIIKKEFSGLLWADEGGGFRRRGTKSGYGFAISYEICPEGNNTTVRLWLSYSESHFSAGYGAWGKMGRVCKKLYR
ncbi:MAG: hypothetical protein LBS62_12940 [Clostridiales bacterium]|jgi:hypothetical protein|nr:hypothetical protein [Clostridiales bacterium]